MAWIVSEVLTVLWPVYEELLGSACSLVGGCACSVNASIQWAPGDFPLPFLHIPPHRKHHYLPNTKVCMGWQRDGDRDWCVFPVHPEVETILPPLFPSTSLSGQSSRAVLLQTFPTSLVTSPPPSILATLPPMHLLFLMVILIDAFLHCPPPLLPLWTKAGETKLPSEAALIGFGNTAGLVSLILSVWK